MPNVRHAKLREKLAVYSISMLQDFLTFLNHCEKNKIDSSEVRGFIQTEIDEGYITADRAFARMETLKKMYVEKMPRCPICDSQLEVEAINNHPARIVDKKSKSWWVCQRVYCDFDPILSKQEPWQEVADLGIPVHKKPKPINPRKKEKRMRAASRQRGCGQKG